MGVVKARRARNEFHGRVVFAEGVGHTEFVSLAKLKRVPLGSEYVAILATIFAPIGMTQAEVDEARKAVSRETQTDEQAA